MAGRWQVLVLWFSFLELPLSAQRAQRAQTSPSTGNTKWEMAKLRGAVQPAHRTWESTASAPVEDEENATLAWRAMLVSAPSVQGAQDVEKPPSRFTEGFQPLSKPVSGAWLEDASSFGADTSTRRLYGLPTRLTSNPDMFDCKTKSCGMHDKFYEILDTRTQFVHENHQCKGALPKAVGSFSAIALDQCVTYAKEKLTWRDCRSLYCDMYEKIVWAVTNGTEYYLGGDCKDILSFNKSICMSYYRDADGFCDCVCPALHLLEATADCKTDIITWLTFGRKGGRLLERFPMTKLCGTYFCKWIEQIADPRNQIKGAPKKCFDFQLPFQRSQCSALMTAIRKSPGPIVLDDMDKPFFSMPYNPCPWDQPSTKDFMLNCTDGYLCDVRVETWACCDRHAKRMRCPRNFPVMCADGLDCVGQSDHCCVEEAAACKSGVRQCSALMMPNMPEWTGGVPPHVPAYIGPTTTMSLRDFKLWLARQPKPTTQPESWGEDIIPFLPFILIPTITVICCMAIVACLCFGADTWKQFQNTLFGARRLMTLMQTDIVHLFSPDDAPREWPDLPPKISDEDRRRMEADQAACEALQDACRVAFAYGRIHLVSVHFAQGRGPQQQSRDIHAAVANVRSRGLQEEGENPRLIEEGLSWCDVLAHETRIVEALEAAFPSLTVDFNNIAPPPIVGAPWAATTVGHAVNCDKRREVWATIEELQHSIKVAEDGGACTGLTQSGHELMNELIARTPELPADRCVLDPSGKGVKLLPKGRQRGLWHHTGDAYLYEPDKQKAGELNDFELPPDEQLMGTSVAPARPVCASYAKEGKCKLGKRCPWRHCKPVAGDSIREPIFFS